MDRRQPSDLPGAAPGLPDKQHDRRGGWGGQSGRRGAVTYYCYTRVCSYMIADEVLYTPGDAHSKVHRLCQCRA